MKQKGERRASQETAYQILDAGTNYVYFFGMIKVQGFLLMIATFTMDREVNVLLLMTKQVLANKCLLFVSPWILHYITLFQNDLY